MKKDMGGLREHMPTTYRTFLIGSIALAGIPPLPALAKDEILHGRWNVLAVQVGGWPRGYDRAYIRAACISLSVVSTAAMVTRTSRRGHNWTAACCRLSIVAVFLASVTAWALTITR